MVSPQHRTTFSAKLSGQADTRWRGLAFSVEGARLGTSSRGSGQVWDANSGKLLATLGEAGQPIGSARFTPDSLRIVSHEGNHARIWDAQTGQLVAALAGHSHTIRGLAISPSGDRLATGVHRQERAPVAAVCQHRRTAAAGQAGRTALPGSG